MSIVKVDYGTIEGGGVPSDLIGKYIYKSTNDLSVGTSSGISDFLVLGVSEISYKITYINGNTLTVYGVNDDDSHTALQTQTTIGTYTVDVSDYNRILFVRTNSSTLAISDITIVS